MKRQLKILLSSTILSCTLLTGTAIINPTILSNQIVSTAEAADYWNGDSRFPAVQHNPDVYIDKTSCCIVDEDEHAMTIAFNLISVYSSGETSVSTCYVRGYDANKGFKFDDINKGSWTSILRAPAIMKADNIAMEVLGLES